MNGHFRVPEPRNEPVLSYAPGTPERKELQSKLDELRNQEIEIPLLIGGEEVRTGDTSTDVVPHDHKHVLATWHQAGAEEATRAADNAMEAWREWSEMDFTDRAAIFLKAADLLAGPWRQTLNAATMLSQSKTAHQAEIDAACELVDFWRFNVYFAQELYGQQPLSSPGMWNRSEYRSLEGFVYAITPFNFTSIGGNLPSAPAIMGNVALFKPSSSAVLSGYYIMKIFEEAGLPPGVINFIPGHPREITSALLSHPDYGGIHFTGSTGVFQSLWKQMGENVAKYKTYPRIVGETGGKDFIVAHSSADPAAVRTAIVRGGYEYQGQKCSAASRAYLPQSIWDEIRDDLVAEIEGLPVGDPTEFSTYVGAVINEGAFKDITGYIDRARASDDAEVVAGGDYDDSEGWFVDPTLIVAKDPRYESMVEEIFGPVVTLYVYPDDEWAETLELVDSTSPYGLTGAVFAQDRKAARQGMDALRHAAGNFYINDKPTGAVVGQQPFGGARASGTNDKAGSALNLVRWVSARSIKETFLPATSYEYPYMEEDPADDR